MSITEATKQNIRENYGKIPLAFIPNKGQVHERVRYYINGSGQSFYFTPEEAVLTFQKKLSSDQKNPSKSIPILEDTEQTIQGMALSLSFIDANPQVKIEGQQEGTGKINYFKGNDPSKWLTNLSTYYEVVYRELWPGVDLVFRGENGQLKYEFVVKPGANIQDIRLSYQGADDLSLDEEGFLQVHTPYGILTDERPKSYQERDGQQVCITSSFFVEQDEKGEKRYGFNVGTNYDPCYPLIIDPGLAYSTFLGGSGTDLGFGIAVDTAGNAYVTGQTNSPNFPTTVGAFQPALAGLTDAFVTKLNPAGSALVFSTYLGGSGDDSGNGIAVDTAGNAYVTGNTNSPNFPTTIGAFQPALAGSSDAFITKLDPAGTALVFSTYLGGSVFDLGSGIAIDALGNTYVTGTTGSPNFPTTAGAFQPALVGFIDAFVTKLNPTGSALVFSTYLGGSGNNVGNGIVVDPMGNVYVTGTTNSPNFPTTVGAFQTAFAGGAFDAFVTKLNLTGSTLVFSTYLGGSGSDGGRGIAVDTAGNAYVTGDTASPNFPTTAGAFDTIFNGGFVDAFVTKLNPVGSALAFSTYLGGSGDDAGFSIAIDAAGNAYVTGRTTSPNFPTTADAFQLAYGGGFEDGFMTKLNPTGSALVFSSYLGGVNSDSGRGIAIDAASNAYVTGTTSSPNFPTTAGAFQTALAGSFDAFVAKIDLAAPCVPNITLTITPVNHPPFTPCPFKITGKVTCSGSPIAGATVTLTKTFSGTGTVAISPTSTTTNAAGDYQSAMTASKPTNGTVTVTASTIVNGTPISTSVTMPVIC